MVECRMESAVIGVGMRRAVPADAERLSALALASKASWGYPPELLELWLPQLTVTPDLIGNALVWVAERAGEPLGFYAVVTDGASAELEHLWVDPRSMARGVGSALLAHALEQSRLYGAVRLEVVSDPNAEGFYLKMGAEPVGYWDSVPEGRRLPVLAFALRPVSDAEV